jgi:hypothetical protein
MCGYSAWQTPTHFASLSVGRSGFETDFFMRVGQRSGLVSETFYLVNRFVAVMRISVRVVAACIAAAMLGACGSDSVTGPSPSGAGSFLAFTSDPGDYIGAGESHRYTLADGGWNVRAVMTPTGAIGGVTVSIRPQPPSAVSWDLGMTAPPGEMLRVGSYENARRLPFNGTQPGLDFGGSGRGCNGLNGRFEILTLQIGPGNTLERLHAVFEQHCDGAPPALRGEVLVLANPLR